MTGRYQSTLIRSLSYLFLLDMGRTHRYTWKHVFSLFQFTYPYFMHFHSLLPPFDSSQQKYKRIDRSAIFFFETSVHCTPPQISYFLLGHSGLQRWSCRASAGVRPRGSSRGRTSGWNAKIHSLLLNQTSSNFQPHYLSISIKNRLAVFTA